MEIKWHDIDSYGQKRYLRAEHFAGEWEFRWKLQRRGEWRRGVKPTRAMWEHVLDSLQRRYRRREGVSEEDITQVERILADLIRREENSIHYPPRRPKSVPAVASTPGEPPASAAEGLTPATEVLARVEGPSVPAPIHISSHPLVHHRLALLRDKRTDPPLFRRMVRELAQILFLEASTDLRLAPFTVATPLADCQGKRLVDNIGLVPILRAGLGMAEAILDTIPEAQVWHLGVYRDHATHEPVTYYNKLSGNARLDVCYVVDPMLATGGSAVAAISFLKEWGVRQLKFLALIAAPEGVQALQAAHPDVPIYLAALDSHLDERRYIVPGLGDAGDRQFATLG